jgi:hypothetical protein
MNHHIKINTIGIALVFAALFIVAVSSAQAGESIWFSGHEEYRPAATFLNGGSCYSDNHNSENIFFAGESGQKQEANAGTCIQTDGRSRSIWFQTDNTSS